MQEVDYSDAFDLTKSEHDELIEAEPTAHEVMYSGVDFDVLGLIRRLETGDIVVPRFGQDGGLDTAGFQRNFVWTRPQMDKFIESILLGYPIPGVFMIRQSNGLLLVLDGQQRLLTLKAFHDGLYAGKEFSLKNVAHVFRDLTFKTLSDTQRRQFENFYIQVTVVRSDGSTESLDAIYQIFERLNSGGTQLTPHEIRMAIYSGPLIDRLNELNGSEEWRSLYGAVSPRVRDQELILRVLAIHSDGDSYARPLKVFLNNFASKSREASGDDLIQSLDLFNRACAKLATSVGPDALRKLGSKQVNAAQTEAIFYGLMRRLEDHDLSDEGAATAVENLRRSDQFGEATSRSTADEEQVRLRLKLAREEFKRAE